MDIKTFYSEVNGDYASTLTRLMNERLMNKFVKKFPNDDSYRLLTDALANKDYETAFRGAHTLKGVSANLGLTQLQSAASELTEAMRGGKVLEDIALYDAVKAEYDKTIALIGQLD